MPIHLPRAEELPPGLEPPRPISVTFIPARVFDNPALLKVNPEYLGYLLSLRRSNKSGCWAAIGRSGRRPGSTSSAGGAPSSTRSRPSSMSCAIGILPRPKRPSSTTPTGPSASSSGAIKRRLLASRYGAPPGQPGRCRAISAQHRDAGRQAGAHRFRPGSGQAGKSQALPPGARAEQFHRRLGLGERRQAHAVRAVQLAMPRRQRA